MTFSPDELRLIERLRRREVQFHQWRWPLAIFGAAKIVAWFILLVIVARFPDDPAGARLIVVAYLLPVCLVFLSLSSIGLGLVLVRWRGDVKTQILLRITDELQRRDA
jgi:hypothetical protein